MDERSVVPSPVASHPSVPLRLSGSTDRFRARPQLLLSNLLSWLRFISEHRKS